MNAHFSRSIRRFRRHAALAAVVYCVALAATATADERDWQPRTKVVNYADLNLNSEAGARALYGRLRLAASQVCAPSKGVALSEFSNWRKCFDLTLARAVKQIDQPVLTAYHLRQTGKPEAPTQIAKDR